MIKRCAICGKEFEPKHGNIKFCSDECRKKAKEKYKNKHLVTNICYSCGRKFKSRRKRKFCSDKCYRDNTPCIGYDNEEMPVELCLSCLRWRCKHDDRK